MTKNISIDIYSGKDPGDVPLYFIPETAHYLRLSAATVRSWVVGRGYRTQAGIVPFRPLISIADPAKNLLSFHNLVELHVLSSIRRIHRIKLREVRKAISYLEDKFQSDHPLLCKEMLTDGKDLFIKEYGKYIAINMDGQLAMKEVMEIYLKRIRWDQYGIPILLFPFTRRDYGRSPSVVSIDPRVRFGKPCIKGTRIPTAIIASRHEAGDDISFLAEDYGRPAEEIEEAIRYESRAAS